MKYDELFCIERYMKMRLTAKLLIDNEGKQTVHSAQVQEETIHSISFNMQGDMTTNSTARDYILYNRYA